MTTSTTSRRGTRVLATRILTAVAVFATLAGCGSSAGEGSSTSAGSPSASATSSTPPTESKQLTVVTHDSFALTESLTKQFTKDTGIAVTFVAPGDAGTVLNQLILAKDSPLGDVVFGIDNTFAGRAIEAGILTPYADALPDSATDLRADGSDALTPIDYGDVCVNADKAWFADKGVAVPATLDDLTKPEYKDLLVVENPASSSPGLAFLAATVGATGDPGYLDYWGALKDNGVKAVKGWTEAYSTEFSGSSGKGPRPLVVSYATSPAFEVPKGADEPNTVALLDTCFRQVEYAGIIAGTQNEIGARKFVDFLLSTPVQEDIPGQMYMYPVQPDAKLPSEWEKFAPLAEKPINVPASEISAKRDQWIKDWTAKVIG